MGTLSPTIQQKRQRISAGAHSFEVAYVEAGAGTPLVLIHGMFGDWRDWAPVVQNLGETFRVFAVDLPGFGDSEKPDAPYDCDFFLVGLHSFFSALALEKPAVVGNSFGGYIAGEYSRRYGHEVSRLVLVSSGGLHDWGDPERRRVMAAMYTQERLVQWKREQVTPLFQHIFVRDSDEKRAYIAKQEGMLTRPDYHDYCRTLERSIRLGVSADLRPHLAEIHVPTLLLWGREDMVIPVTAAEAALLRLPQGSLTLIPGASHMPQMDQPAAFVEAIKTFVLGRNAANAQ